MPKLYRQQSSITGLVDDLNTINQQINNETIRANLVELNLGNRLNIIEGDSSVEGSIKKAIADLINGAPLALDTLNEIVNQLNSDEDVISSIITSIGLKAPIASPTFTGTVNGITKSMVGLSNVDNTTDLLKPISTATQTALDLKANQITTYTKTETDTKIQTVVGEAPLNLNTLKKIADYINVSPNIDVLSAITQLILQAKTELIGTASWNMNTLGEIETVVNALGVSDSNKLTKSNNLSDVQDKTQARTNLNLGTSSTYNVGNNVGNIPVINTLGKLDDSIISINGGYF